ncbi:MAG: lysophospholipid acyltransferase family protein [Actinomycetota bacterium]|nr:lysophospholipid acyltransferase family protein [Actinomycetota bacterium]
MDAKQRRTWALEVGRARSSLVVHRIARILLRGIAFPWLRVVVEGEERLQLDGPLIVAPVHRSVLDPPLVGAVLRKRRLRALGKSSLFDNRLVGWLCAALGAFPVERGVADREALKASREVLDAGEPLLVFPEGTRQRGSELHPLFEGAAWLSMRCGAPIVPVGIAGTEAAMPSGARFPRRAKVAIVVGELIPASVHRPTGRLDRVELARLTDELAVSLSEVFERARVVADDGTGPATAA